MSIFHLPDQLLEQIYPAFLVDRHRKTGLLYQRPGSTQAFL